LSTSVKTGRKPRTIDVEPIPDIVVNSSELVKAVEYKQDNAPINYLVQHGKDMSKLVDNSLERNHKLTDMVAELRYSLGKIESENHHLTGMNNLLQMEIDRLKLTIEEYNNYEEEEEEETEQENITTINGISSLIQEVKNIMPMLMNKQEPTTINAAAQDPVLPNEFFGENNSMLLSMLVDWYNVDNSMAETLHKVVNLAKTDINKYNLAKSML
jgi:DNA repair ATPase RecN